jgi:hypothetical protein
MIQTCSKSGGYKSRDATIYVCMICVNRVSVGVTSVVVKCD